MTTRREFLEIAGKAAALGAVAGALPACEAVAQPGPAHLTYGVQMFEVRRQAETDLRGALGLIKQAGFAQVETYPVAYKAAPEELRRMIGEAGLGAVSGHFDYTGRAMSVDYARKLGLKYLVCPMLPHDQWTSADGFKKAADHFNGWGREAQAAGLQFVFHNHDYEFKPLDANGTRGWDVLMTNTDPALVKLEFDFYWLTQAGQDPMAMLKRYAQRAVLVHMKDRTAGAPTSFDMDKHSEHFVELGKGSIDWPALLRQARAQGIAYAFLDQDETALPVEQSMQLSRGYLRSINV